MAKKICVVIGSRANYGSIKSAMRAIKNHPELELQVVAAASALLDRYGAVANLIEKDGFTINSKVYVLLEGETLVTMAKSTGIGLMEFTTVFDQLKPDVVLTVGDRFETMATAVAAAYLNIPLAQTMGGEVSGTIDESIRHAVTKLAHIHFPACQDAKDRIIKMGEEPANVHLVGCPRMDLVAEVLKQGTDIANDLFKLGVGGNFDLNKPFVVVSQHPVTTEYGDGEKQITKTLMAVQSLGISAIILWPNADAGSEHVARGIRKFREHNDDSNMHFFKNLPTEVYIKLLAKTACLVGNSSSAIREGSFIGTPAVNIGSRQQGRQRGANIIDVDYDRNHIADAIKHQLSHGRYNAEPIYGDGHAGERIADILHKATVSVQKRITY
ncbi:UDP-N-acetylglucosamine 2-epimerase (hydrolyzing) [Candidatus Peregrinibacteria bacterium]|nr:UDP-N-acetylglucosamine 2-epimerase (hydrolyzing) [Candidatus Peregrinibacteria bacterium]